MCLRKQGVSPRADELAEPVFRYTIARHGIGPDPADVMVLMVRADKNLGQHRIGHHAAAIGSAIFAKLGILSLAFGVADKFAITACDRRRNGFAIRLEAKVQEGGDTEDAIAAFSTTAPGQRRENDILANRELGKFAKG